MRSLLLCAILGVSIPVVPQSQGGKTGGPDCSGGWPTSMTLVQLKNAGLIVDNKDIDLSKTKTVRLASERVSNDLWHQVYHVTFTEKSGGRLEAIAVHDASGEECSMTGVEVFVVSKHLNPERK